MYLTRVATIHKGTLHLRRDQGPHIQPPTRRHKRTHVHAAVAGGGAEAKAGRGAQASGRVGGADGLGHVGVQDDALQRAGRVLSHLHEVGRVWVRGCRGRQSGVCAGCGA